MGSSPTTPSMITFKYNNKQYTTNNLENKLNKLGITKEDIEILGNRDLGEIDTSIKKYYFKNIKTGEIIVSVYPDLRNLENIINVNDYEKCEKRLCK